MATAAQDIVPTSESTDSDRIVSFSLERLHAPFLLRCAALCIDYIVLLVVPIGWLILGKFVTDNGIVVITGWIWLVGLVLFLANFIVFPMLRGKTVGKQLLGLTIINIDGSSLTFWGAIKRNIIGYAATILTGGLGFLIAAVNESGRSLHDFIGGTAVIRGRRIKV